MSIHALQAPRFTLTPDRDTRRHDTRRHDTATAAVGGASRPTFRAAPRSAPASLHLTRRGRLLFLGVPVLMMTAMLLTALALVTTAPASAEQSVHRVPSTPAVQVTVQPGESLWDVAAANAQGRDTRDVLAGIVALNGLQDDHLDAGRKLYVPLDS